MKLNSLMIDTETLGTRPGSMILSIGAVAFDSESHFNQNTFSVNLKTQYQRRVGLTADPDTVAWWDEQSEEVYRAARSNPVAPRQALADLTEFVEGLDENVRVWCQGANFDDPLLTAVFDAFKMPVPWKFYNVRDTRTVYDMASSVSIWEKPKRTETAHHTALGDALYQVKCLASAEGAIATEFRRRGAADAGAATAANVPQPPSRKWYEFW